jgi:hypothetical protein
LTNARIARDVNMDGAVFDGELNANSLQVGADLRMTAADDNKVCRFKKDVKLGNAKVTGVFDMRRAVFDGKLSADSLQVGKDLFMRRAQFSGQVSMISASVGANLDLRGATMVSLELSETSIGPGFRAGRG